MEQKKAFYEDEISHLNQTIDKLKAELSEVEHKIAHQVSKTDIGSLNNLNVW